VLLFWAFFLWQTTFELTKIDIEGLSRFQPDAVLGTVGLKPGAKAGKVEFDAACQRLIQSGLFQGCNWKYLPTSTTGIALTIQLNEAPAPQTARLTVPGVPEKQLWDWLRENEPLVTTEMPASDDALQFYTQAIRRFLKQDVVSSVDTNLETKENVLVFRPANLPKIESVKFERAKVIAADVLERSVAPIAQGMPFTEFDVNQVLDLNVRPLYERLGHLNVKFPSIKATDGAVSVQVDEGIVYKIGDVTATGGQPALVKGEIANWQAITSLLDAVTAGLRNQGYLNARYKVDRKLNESAGTVDIQVAYDPGKQFIFGALKLGGLTPAQESAVRRVWTHPAGAPMNAGYVDEFIKAAFGKIGEEYSGVASQIEPTGENKVDVEITFRRR
jgi:outer membrane protein assembly factor BamA